MNRCLQAISTLIVDEEISSETGHDHGAQATSIGDGDCGVEDWSGED